MKTIFIAAGAVALIIGLFYFFPFAATGAGILEKRANILRYEIGGSVTDNAFLSYEFRKNADGEWLAQGFVDANGDGAFTEDEWLVRNEPARVMKGFPNRFSIPLPDALKDADVPQTVAVSLALTQEPIDAASALPEKSGHVLEAIIETEIIDTEFGLDVPGASPNLKRGVGFIEYAYAQESAQGGVNGTNLPDLAGGPMDCFAIATANNLINMAEQNGRRDDLPENPQELIDALKDAMQWDDGIVNANFLTGKAQIITDIGFPVETEEIRRPTIEQLKEALASGDGVEISTTMLNSKSGKPDTGHVFTGVSATNQTVSVHDPATPQGTDTLGTAMTSGRTPYIAIAYPMWDGITVVDAIYIQRWKTETGAEKSSTAMEEPKSESAVSSGNAQPVMKKEPEVEATFAHVKPGEYSEVYAVVTGLTPGTEVTAKLFRDDWESGAPQVVDADQNGVAHFTFRITSYGHYNVNITAPSHGYVGGASVDVR